MSPATPSPKYPATPQKLVDSLANLGVTAEVKPAGAMLWSVRAGTCAIYYGDINDQFYRDDIKLTLAGAITTLQVAHTEAQDKRPLIERLREAVPGLEWERKRGDLLGRSPLEIRENEPAVCVGTGGLLCWLDNRSEPHSINAARPSDNEVVRIVKDWYAKTHPAKSVTERTKELIREAVPGVEIREERGRAETRLVCMVPPGTAPFVGTIPDEMTIADLERNKGVIVDAVRKALVKPTNTEPAWVPGMRAGLNAHTSDSWLAECVEGFWQVSSAKNGQKLVATVVDGFFRLEVHEGSAVLPYRKLMLPELLELAKTLCKARNDLEHPEEVTRFAREMRDAGFEVETKQASTNESVHITVRSKATGKESRLHYGTLVGWTCDGVPNLTIGQANSRARLALTKPNNEASQEHEAFEKKAREATTQYPQNAGMAVANVTPTMTANAMVDLLASQGVEATIETIDDHAAVCVTDPSTGEVHKAICDPAGNWLMDGEEVYGLVAATELRELGQRQKKEKAMGKSTRRQRIEQGIYLGAAKSATDKARDGVVALLASGLPAEEQAGARAVLAKILETEIGAGAFGFVMGEAVDLAAGQFEGESPKVEAFAEALQVVGAMRGANTVIDALFEPITSAISGMIAAIPEPPKVRATPDAPAEEHEEPAHTGRKARAAR